MQERREGMAELNAKIDLIVKNQAEIRQYLESQFGSVDLVGTPVEGITTKALRQLGEKQDKTNGRVTKLELHTTFIKGAIAVMAFGIPIFVEYMFGRK